MRAPWRPRRKKHTITPGKRHSTVCITELADGEPCNWPIYQYRHASGRFYWRHYPS